jgi:hypothetical protein
VSFLDFDGFVFFAISLLVLIVIQRLLQKEIQIVLLLITGNPNLAIGIFSILLLPGVFIHEFSHLMMSILLRVPVLKLSLVPEVTKKGRIRLGFVQTAKTDVVRDSLIGLAPFIVGLVLLALIGTLKFGITAIANQSIADYFEVLLSFSKEIPKVTDFGIWLYLAFAISTTMIPSESDRQSWKLIFIVLFLVLSVVFLSGLGDWMMTQIYPTINKWLFSLGIILVGSAIIHVLLIIPVWLLRQVIQIVSGYRVAKN